MPVSEYFRTKQPDNPSWTSKLKFYAKMHQVWNKFHCFQPKNEQEVRRETVWHNRWITSAGAPLQHLQCHRAGIRNIAHICHETKARILSHTKLNAKYGTNISFLDMLRIRLSTPPSLEADDYSERDPSTHTTITN